MVDGLSDSASGWVRAQSRGRCPTIDRSDSQCLARLLAQSHVSGVLSYSLRRTTVVPTVTQEREVRDTPSLETSSPTPGPGPVPGSALRLWRWVALAAVAVGVAACASEKGEWDDFAVAPAESRQPTLAFGEQNSARLERVTTIGDDSGSEDQHFGSIGGAAFGADGSIYVTDRFERRVAQYDSAGKLIRYFGRKGTGPGEFLSPAQIAVSEAEVAVVDREAGRVAVFDTAGCS